MAHEIKLRFSHKYNLFGYSELYFTISLQNMKKRPFAIGYLVRTKRRIWQETDLVLNIFLNLE